MPATLRALAPDNSIGQWWRKLVEARKRPEGVFTAMNFFAMAASYDPDPTAFLGMRPPVTFDTCEVIAERWANWMRHAPVVAVETHIDCGDRDQFSLLYGACRLVRRLNELRITHRYEEFPDNHSGVDYRMDESLPFLAAALGS